MSNSEDVKSKEGSDAPKTSVSAQFKDTSRALVDQTILKKRHLEEHLFWGEVTGTCIAIVVCDDVNLIPAEITDSTDIKITQSHVEAARSGVPVIGFQSTEWTLNASTPEKLIEVVTAMRVIAPNIKINGVSGLSGVIKDLPKSIGGFLRKGKGE